MRYFLVTILFIFSTSAFANDVQVNLVQATGLAGLEQKCNDFKENKWQQLILGSATETEPIPEDKKEECQTLLTLRENGNFGKLPFVAVAQNQQHVQGANQATAGQSGQAATAGCVGSEYAVDYKNCKGAVDELNAMAILEEAMAFQHNEKLTNVQRELSLMAQTSNGSSKVALEAQIEELNVRINQNNNMGYLYSGKAAEIGRLIAIWPTQKNITKKMKGCDQSNSDICKELARTYGNDLAPNQGFRNQLLRSVQELGIKGAGILTENNRMKEQRKLLEAQLGIVAGASDGVNEFLTTYCQSDQGRADIEKCGAFASNPNFNTAGLANFGDDQEWSVANIGDNSVQGISGDFNPNNPVTGEGQDSIRDGLLDFDNEKSSGGFLDNPTAGGGGQGQGMGQQGGGAAPGGGAGGGGGAGPGLSTRPNQPGDQELASLTKVKADAAYGKSKGSFYKKAKRGRTTRRGDDDDTSKKGLGELGIFGRSPAEDAPVGPQNIALFDLISDRYEIVKEQGRVKK